MELLLSWTSHLFIPADNYTYSPFIHFPSSQTILRFFGMRRWFIEFRGRQKWLPCMDSVLFSLLSFFFFLNAIQDRKEKHFLFTIQVKFNRRELKKRLECVFTFNQPSLSRQWYSHKVYSSGVRTAFSGEIFLTFFFRNPDRRRKKKKTVKETKEDERGVLQFQ